MEIREFMKRQGFTLEREGYAQGTEYLCYKKGDVTVHIEIEER